jgi:hypothetical protein
MKRITWIIPCLLVCFFIAGCSDDDATKETTPITGLGLYDAELYDFVFFINRDKLADGTCSAPQVGVAVLQAGTSLQSLDVTINGMTYPFEDLAGGRLWYWANPDSTVCCDETVNNVSITASGTAYNEELAALQTLELSHSFALENPCSTCNCQFPDSLYILSYDQFNRPVYTAITGELNWELNHSNENQILTVNKSCYANPRDYELVIDPAKRSLTLDCQPYKDDPKNVRLTVSQMNTAIEQRFASYSRCNVHKQYNGSPAPSSLPTLAEIRAHLNALR